MIENGRFYKAGMIKDIDPGRPESTEPYYLKAEENDILPEGTVVEEGEFAIYSIMINLDDKDSKNNIGYYIRATEEIKRQIKKNMEKFAKSMAQLLLQRVQEYQEKGLDYFEEIRKQTNNEEQSPLNYGAEKIKQIDEQINRQEATVLALKKRYEASMAKLSQLIEKKKQMESKQLS